MSDITQMDYASLSQDDLDALAYVSDMAEQLSNMMAVRNFKIVAYILLMASKAAREHEQR